MTLVPVDFPGRTLGERLPGEVEELLEEADQRIERFLFDRKDRPIFGFVPCDFVTVYRLLREVAACRLATGFRFCEWGSGYGVVTLLAAQLGFDAVGLEVEAALVSEAEALARDFELDADFYEGSFIPDGGDQYVRWIEDLSHVDTSAPAAYDEVGLEVDDFDVVFAYPWPGEESFVEDLFNQFAAHGALLLTYRGLEDVRLQRKVRSARD